MLSHEELKEKVTKGICTDMEGKMEGVWSLSTCCATNPLCKKYHKIKGSICEKCYAHTLMELRKALEDKTKRNTEILTKEHLTIMKSTPELPATVKYFRFEAFGDVQNSTQLMNYVMIALQNPHVRFALFSKNYNLILTFFKGDTTVPKNLTVVVSSLFINRPIRSEVFYRTCHGFAPGQLKVFTVYDYDYLKEHPEVEINCGSRSCMKCGLCYKENSQVAVREILKAHQEKAERMIKMREPKKMDDLFASLSEIFKEGLDKSEEER